MDQRAIVAAMGGGVVLLAGVTLWWLTPSDDPLLDRPEKEARERTPERRAIRPPPEALAAVEEAAPPPVAERPEGFDEDVLEPEVSRDAVKMDKDEIVQLPAPLPATAQGIKMLFDRHGQVAQQCMEEVAPPQPDDPPRPSRVAIEFTVGGASDGDAAITGIEIKGDYDQTFTPFARCMAHRLQAVRFTAPAGGMTTRLTWQQHVPKRRPE